MSKIINALTIIVVCSIQLGMLPIMVTLGILILINKYYDWLDKEIKILHKRLK